jgi:hypothetical protein
MGPHAGFAAAIAIGGETMQDLLRVLYAANRIDHFFEVDNPFPGGAGGVSGRLTVELPRLSLAADEDRLRLDIRCWGPLTIELPGSPAATRNVLFAAKVFVRPSLTVRGRDVRFGLDGRTARLDELERTVLGVDFPTASQGILDSDLFKDGFEDALRTRLADQKGAPLNATFLGGLATTENKTVRARVLDSGVLVGIDVDAEVDGESIRTSGDAAQLTDFRDGRSVAFALNPAVAPLAFSDVRKSVIREVHKQNASLESFDLAYRGDHLHASGTAVRSPGSVDFSFELFPHLDRSLSFQTTNVEVNVNVPWWARLFETILGVFSFGLAAFGVESYIDMIRGSVVRGIEDDSAVAARRWQMFTLTGTRRPRIILEIESYDLRPDGVVSTVTLSPILRRETSLHLAARAYRDAQTHVQVFGSVRLPLDFVRDDPQLRVRWTTRRLDTNTQIDTLDAPIADARTYRRNLAVAGADSDTSFNVECRVYRTLGATTEEVLNESQGFATEAPPDPAKRFLRWRLDTITPTVVVAKDDSLRTVGREKVTRHSRIHRLDLPNRCLFATEGGPHFTGRFQFAVPYEVEYLAELPFPRSQLARHRGQLCDYCFFGGPTETEPLPLP